LIWAGFLLFTGSRTSAQMPVPELKYGLDKLAHVATYGLLGLLLRRASGRFLAAVGIAVAIGLLDEWLQSAAAGRRASLLDLAADAAGAAVGAWAWRRLSAGRENARI
jgi:VanZ family protein